MKTQWIYFISGACLITAVMTFIIPRDSSDSIRNDCKAVAHALIQARVGSDGEAIKTRNKLTFHQRRVYESFLIDKNLGVNSSSWDYLEAYRYCISVETPSK